MYIPSVKEAARKIVGYYNREAYEELKTVGKYLENNDVAKSISGDGDEFHNATVELTRQGFYDYAYSLANVGHSRYPCNTDLLGDLIGYGLHCRPLNELQQWYEKLKKINKRFWTWRAYQFSFDYWMERLPYAENEDELDTWENIIVNIFESFKQNFEFLRDKSDCEKAYMMEFKYYNSKGEEEKAISALKAATEDERTINKCAQCALKLATRYFEMGDYDNSFIYANMAVEIKEDQPSINLGYTYYILAMSLEWKEKKNHSIASNIRQVYNAYFAAYIHLDSDKTNLLDLVKKQVKQLEFEFGQSSDILFDDLDNEKYDNMPSILKLLNNNNFDQAD